VADVVAVAEVRDAHVVEAAETLANRHDVGERLARVELVGEAVDDRDLGVLGQFVHVALRESANHDRVEVAREDMGRVLDRLPAAQL
jgi:hypothetical protein